MSAYLSAIAVHFPETVLTNGQLQAENQDWDMARIEGKVGIRSRHIASPDECASDLAFAAAEKLLQRLELERSSIDALIFVTQSPDYFLPATACVLQARLQLSTRCAAFDVNQGCSGYVYGLGLAKGMIAAGLARRVLLLTGETYTKFIHPRDRSVRIIFGDASTASLVTDEPNGAAIGEFALGTDGAGYKNLIVPAGGLRTPLSAETAAVTTDENGSSRSPENLFMEGNELFLFTLKRVPEVVKAVLQKAQLAVEDVDWFIFHQANAFMNEHLRQKLKVPREKAPLHLEHVGNTVSNTLPVTLHAVGEPFQTGHKVLLSGFGVGYSWGACMLEWGEVVLV